MSDDPGRAIRDRANPRIDATGATWLWQGENPPLLAGDFTAWSSGIAPHRSGPHSWTYRVDLPSDAYAEYAFFDVVGDDDTRRSDPLAPTRVSNGIGQWNHPIRMPDRPSKPRRRLGGPKGP